jgi:hypothetical protein
LALALAACAGPPATPVHDPLVVAFASRIEEFYGGLVGMPLDSELTFQSRALRSYFVDPGGFSDYYASIANQVRSAHMRNARATSVEIMEFRFEAPDRARVDVEVRGDHMRGLIPWDVSVQRSDTWRQVGGTWYVTPEKL